mmetsp:Transcript_33648/g.71804  ORF Transcript_33648/g.71804 Transcript_33648/m.71804 type:complete len:381 (-) Transcript_33648:420-1562(-)|eukprot:CAMPEP_0183332990 /NCGR_PEP_ID=MMETSP0164_2-20130417/2016_1 /TAXON_ID=221442 /ORGANISM="Coccolithus pelagicus ssp braarudi, Strain PLY182g" /LENGTH=380 /DNA_ID=CAMNT_0025501813 /DNA_START=44 /DNA_END=1186 /DNA_ORIENTATION=+
MSVACSVGEDEWDLGTLKEIDDVVAAHRASTSECNVGSSVSVSVPTAATGPFGGFAAAAGGAVLESCNLNRPSGIVMPAPPAKVEPQPLRADGHAVDADEGECMEHSSVPLPPPVVDEVAAQTWVYPAKQSARSYQRFVSHTELLRNTLVSLPTGIGKTLIRAAAVPLQQQSQEQACTLLARPAPPRTQIPPPPRTKSTIAKASRSTAKVSGSGLGRGGDQPTLLSLAASGQWGHAGDSGEGQRTGGKTARPGAMRQASIEHMPGVINWRRGARESALEGVPSTLYLGEADVLRIKERLSAATASGDESTSLALLQRLAAMPCTRPLLESTGIGVVVGSLRHNESASVAQLAERLVKVWKGQLKEHRAQSASTARAGPKG